MKKRKVQVVIFHCNAHKEKEILLMRMNERRHHFWQNVTGKVEENESYEAAAIREVIEETALEKNNIKEFGPLDMEFSFVDQWSEQVHEKVFFIECNEKWVIQIDPSEHDDYKWVNEKDIHPQIVHFPSNYQAIELAMRSVC